MWSLARPCRPLAHPCRPLTIVAAACALSAVGALWGCVDVEVFVRSRPGLDPKPLPSLVWLVVVTRDPPPPQAAFIGELAFLCDVDDLPVALDRIRASARRLGADLVASLRCRPDEHFDPKAHITFDKSEPLKPGKRLHCYAKIYQVP